MSSADDALPWTVFKFGGTSMGTVESLGRVLSICTAHLSQSPGARLAVVVSAMSGVTDELLKAAAHAERRDARYLAVLAGIEDRHEATARALLMGDTAAAPGDDAEASSDAPVNTSTTSVRSHGPRRSVDVECASTFPTDVRVPPVMHEFICIYFMYFVSLFLALFFRCAFIKPLKTCANGVRSLLVD
jgi:hypothetical protein